MDGGGNAFRVGFPSFGQNTAVSNVRQADFFQRSWIQLSPAYLAPFKTPFDLVITRRPAALQTSAGSVVCRLSLIAVALIF